MRDGGFDTLELAHPTGRTRILIGGRLLAAAAGDRGLAAWLDGRTVFVLSSPRVRELHGRALTALLAPARRVVDLEAADGEGAKQVGVAEQLWQEMLAAGGKRDSRLLAFGGGSICDLGGFVAGCFLRGIEVSQVPTTLLAQVDAAVGGKTGVDLPGGKNTVGLFHHPAWVLSDTSLLATLPARELRSGLVEVIKMAALLDPPLLRRLEDELEAILGADPEALAAVVAGAAAAKAAVVEKDAGEKGLRRVLNFGHTLGHAIEGVLGYAELRHGEAVAYGLLFATRLARRRGLKADFAARLRRLLARLDLPPLPPLDPASLLAYMGRDKKAMETGLVWVLPTALGRFEMTAALDPREVRQELEGFLTEPWAVV